jgi:hypothetical protein
MRTLPANGPGLFLSVHQKVPKLVLECQRQAAINPQPAMTALT